MNKTNPLINSLEIETMMMNGNYDKALPLLLNALESEAPLERPLVLSNVAICYLHSQKYADARFYLEKLLEFQPDNTTALYNLSYCLLMEKNYKRSIESFEKLKKKEGQSFDIAYNLGFAYLGDNQVDSALENFDYLFENKIAPDLIYNIGIAMISIKRPEHARDLFLKYLSKAENDIDATFGLGIAYQQSEEYLKAVECLKRVVQWNPGRYPSATVSLGMAYYQSGEIEAAIQTLNKAIEQGFDPHDAWFYLGTIFEHQGNYEKAIAALNKAGELDHKMHEVWEKLGTIYLRVKKNHEARISYKKAYLLTHDTRIAYKLGLLSLLDNDYRSGKTFFETCLEQKDPDTYKEHEVLENLAICNYNIDEFSIALKYSEETLKLNPGRGLLYFIAGNSSMKLGMLDKAESYLLDGYKYDPDNAMLLYTLGVLEANLGKFEESAGYLEKSLLLEKNPETLYALALARIKQGKKKEAAEILSLYQSLMGNDTRSLYKLGLMYIDIGDHSRALEAFKSILIIEPDHEKAIEYIRLLQQKKGT